jgi:hypothetical protein
MEAGRTFREWRTEALQRRMEASWCLMRGKEVLEGRMEAVVEIGSIQTGRPLRRRVEVGLVRMESGSPLRRRMEVALVRMEVGLVRMESGEPP